MPKKYFWRTIKIGTYDNMDVLYQALSDANIDITKEVDAVLEQITLSRTEKALDIAIVSRSDLGLPAGGQVTNEMIFRAANERGLGLCPAEVGPQLRLQYPDQPETEYLVIGMTPIMSTDPMLFTVYHAYDADLALNIDFGNPGYWFADKALYAFVCGEDGS